MKMIIGKRDLSQSVIKWFRAEKYNNVQEGDFNHLISVRVKVEVRYRWVRERERGL